MSSSPSDDEMGLSAHRVTFPVFSYEQLLGKLSLLTNNTSGVSLSLSRDNNILTLDSPAWKTRGGSGGTYFEVRRLGENEDGIAKNFYGESFQTTDVLAPWVHRVHPPVTQWVSFARLREGAETRGIAYCKCLLQYAAHEIRLCPRLDRGPKPRFAACGLQEGRVQNRVQGRGLFRGHDHSTSNAVEPVGVLTFTLAPAVPCPAFLFGINRIANVFGDVHHDRD